MTESDNIFAFALLLPVYHLFDYRLPDKASAVSGQRYRLPFGRGQKLGVLVSAPSSTGHDADKIKPVLEQLDEEPVLSAHLVDLARWMADYYCQPLGEVLFHCLPRYCRAARSIRPTSIEMWKAAPVDAAALHALKARAPRQHAILQALQSGRGMNAADLKVVHEGWRQQIKVLESKGLVIRSRQENLPVDDTRVEDGPPLTEQQSQAVLGISDYLGHFQVHLLQGVTGSGKTEVYLALMQQVIARHQQVIYLVPEIGLTPQLLRRLRRRLGPAVVSSHSAQSDFQRYQSWDQFRRGVASVIIGTRSALFSQCPSLGLIIVDEEHDASYRQQDGVRYHARDVAIKRAQMLDVPIVLGTATPSLESLHNLQKAHYHRHLLEHRPDNSDPPPIRLIDCSNSPMHAGCSPPMLQAVERHLDAGKQVLLFLNRRGYAPVVRCSGCGWQAECHQCDARLTLHQTINRLICHHCGHSQVAKERCPQCGEANIRHYGIGTQQLEEFLASRFRQAEVIRIDRDNVTSSQSMQVRMQPVREGRPCILVGTQMLAKGHDYPNITLVGIIDADQALHSSFYRAGERLVQTVLQVAGRAGRAESNGEALLQTAFADHPLMRGLSGQGYNELVKPLLEERRLLGFPPFARVISFVADAFDAELAIEHLSSVREIIEGVKPAAGIQIIGPIPALMARRVGRYRAQLTLISDTRHPLRTLMHALMPKIVGMRRNGKSQLVIEVDPVDL